jgi:SAM-dependent MidA family methyltransferase
MPAHETPAGLPLPGAADRARSDRLLECIAGRIADAGGWLPFADYMQLALYAPALGYYDAQGCKFGAQGDFVTAPEISPLFARALSVQVEQAFERLAPRVLEFGAGSGALAYELIHALRARGVELAGYQILEVSADLRARQQELLEGLPVRWLDALPEAFEGVVLANEVLDVLPVRLFVAGAPVMERGVVLERGALRFAGRPAAAELAREVLRLEAAAGPWPPGYGSEVCPLAGAWIAALGACLERALVLLIDYGFPQREYYHAQRAMGTLMCHYRQHAHADPLWLPGLSDITAHVDFSACARAAREAGMEVLGYASQAHFLLNCGILELLDPPASPGYPAQAGAVQRLLSEAEMGELVKVLALGRGMEAPALAGFARGDRRDRLA